MLETYQAKLINNQIHWQGERPCIDNTDVIITILPQTNNGTPKRQPPAELKGMGKTTGDIIDVPELTEMWEMHDDFDNS